jgi:hypothetical protein
VTNLVRSAEPCSLRGLCGVCAFSLFSDAGATIEAGATTIRAPIQPPLCLCENVGKLSTAAGEKIWKELSFSGRQDGGELGGTTLDGTLVDYINRAVRMGLRRNHICREDWRLISDLHRQSPDAKLNRQERTNRNPISNA